MENLPEGPEPEGSDKTNPTPRGGPAAIAVEGDSVRQFCDFGFGPRPRGVGRQLVLGQAHWDSGLAVPSAKRLPKPRPPGRKPYSPRSAAAFSEISRILRQVGFESESQNPPGNVCKRCKTPRPETFCIFCIWFLTVFENRSPPGWKQDTIRLSPRDDPLELRPVVADRHGQR
jgi:hypothetical protein